MALKGKRLAFVEVKRRKTAEDAAWTLPAKQRRRQGRAIYWLAGHPNFSAMTSLSTWCSPRRGGFPRYIENAFSVA